jgi:hypothetical protein
MEDTNVPPTIPKAENPSAIPEKKQQRKPFVFILSIILLISITSAIAGLMVFPKPAGVPLPQKHPEQATTPIISPTPRQFVCEKVSSEKIILQKKGATITLHDFYHGYELDVTQLPEITLEEPGCANMYYEVEMYKKVNGGNNSVARFNIMEAHDNPSGMTLEEFAKSDLQYIEGEHIYAGSIHPVTTSPFSTISFANGLKGISWSYKYADLDEVRENVLGGKYYLIAAGDKIIPIQLISWDTTSLNRAIKDFDQVIVSFKLTKPMP